MQQVVLNLKFLIHENLTEKYSTFLVDLCFVFLIFLYKKFPLSCPGMESITVSNIKMPVDYNHGLQQLNKISLIKTKYGSSRLFEYYE